MPSKKKVKTDNSGKRDKFFKVGIVIVTVVFIYIIYQIFNMVILKNERIDLSGENYYQYFFGIKEEYGGKINLFKSDKATQLILENNKVINLDSTPMYYKDVLGKVLFPAKMEVVSPITGYLYKMEEFSNIIQENGVMYARRLKGNKNRALNSNFIYDGKDLYFLLEETNITIGKKKYKLSPLSYVIVNYRQNVELYDYDKDEYTILSEDQVSSSDVIATNKSKSYTINMSLDTFATSSNNQLLIKSIDELTGLDY